MRKIRYSVAMSLDGFIATEDGGYDWIVDEPAIDFARYLEKIDTLLMGRGTYEIMDNPEAGQLLEAKTVYVVSTTLAPDVDPRVDVISSDVEVRVQELKEADGLDIWLFGGGVLFRSMLSAGLVDRVEVAVIPALLGSGIPLVPGLDAIAALQLHSTETFSDSGIVLLKYDVAASGHAGASA